MAEVAQELAAWKRETRDFLLQDASAAASAALKELERLDLLWGRIRFSRSASTVAIKADVRGHLVVLANLEVKLPSKSARSSAVLAALQQYCVLNQILEFHAIVQTQRGRLAALKGFLDSQQEELGSGDLQHADLDSYIDTVQATFQSLTRVCADLRNAANVLRLPSRRRFPYSSHVDHTFKSPLPPELVVDFSIHRGELLIEVFSVVASQKIPAAIPEGCATKKEFAGCVCNLRGQRVEIADYASIAVPIPQIEEMLSHLDAQVAWLVRVRDNTKALLDCHLA
ncbi:hypothetical protein PybrP1_000370 [[Pythium] brassicae (nom. inval.)]|nr:hypothetical protein PybrP1_000370 [[Pythium] brassicae (nom. inval.)]